METPESDTPPHSPSPLDSQSIASPRQTTAVQKSQDTFFHQMEQELPHTFFKHGDFSNPADQAIPWKKILKIPEFDGNERSVEAVDYWIHRIEQYAICSGISDTAKLQIAVTQLGRSGNLWWRSLGTEAPTTWSDFVSRLKRQYYPANHLQASRDAFFNCKQTKGVGEYVDRFRRIALGVPELTRFEAIDKFVRGLKPRVQQQARLQEFDSLDSAYAFADRVDRAQYSFTSSSSFFSSSSANPTGRPSYFSNYYNNNKPSVQPTTGMPMEIDHLEIESQEREENDQEW